MGCRRLWLGKFSHGGVQRRRTPAGIEDDPSEIDDVAVVPVAIGMKVGQPVERVRNESADSTYGQELPGGIAKPTVTPQVGQHGQHEYVTQRVGGRGEPDESGSGAPHVGSDEKNPRQESDAERDGEGIDQARPVAPRNPLADQEQQADRQHRVHRDVDGVDEGRERNLLLADELVPRLVGGVARDEQQNPGAENPPCDRSVRLVAADSVDDGGDGRQAHQRPGRNLPGPLHPREDPEDTRLARRRSERKVDQGEDRLEGQEPPPRGGRHPLHAPLLSERSPCVHVSLLASSLGPSYLEN
jgi:hypothetical protein